MILIKKKANVKIILMIFAVFITSGCATTPKINYTARMDKVPANGVSVWVKDFGDARPVQERGVLGGMYNGYGTRMGEVLEPEDLIGTLKGALESELSNAGYTIVQDDRDLLIIARLESVTCEVRNAKEANLHVNLKVEDKGEEVLNHLYTVNNSIYWTLDTTCSGPLTNTIEEIVVEFASDLNEYIQS